MIPKAFFIDVDKTLTNSRREISPVLKQVLHQFEERKIPLAVCTGRHYAALKHDVLSLFSDTMIHIVCGGGQLVKNSGEVIWEKCISADVVQSIVDKVKDTNGWCGFGVDDVMYITENVIDVYKQRNVWKMKVESISNEMRFSTPLIFSSVLDEDHLHFLKKLELEVKILSPKSLGIGKYADITMKGITKASGMEQWCKYMNIQPEEVVAVGDSLNDVEMLRFAGFPVAMGNAADEIKLLAKRVIGHTDEDGLATFLQSYLDTGSVLQ